MLLYWLCAVFHSCVVPNGLSIILHLVNHLSVTHPLDFPLHRN